MTHKGLATVPASRHVLLLALVDLVLMPSRSRAAADLRLPQTGSS